MLTTNPTMIILPYQKILFLKIQADHIIVAKTIHKAFFQAQKETLQTMTQKQPTQY